MLLSFSIKNWRSYKEESSFSLTASRERRGNEHLTVLPSKYRSSRVLPLAAIYGANASGKTTFFEALEFLRNMVVRGTQVNQMIPVEGFALDPSLQREPTSLQISFLVDDSIYNYSVLLTKAAVEKETLSVRASKGSQLIYSRIEDRYEFGSKYESERHSFIASGTRSNQLFLHNAVSQNAEAFLPMFNWFSNTLEIVGVDAEYERYSQMLLRDDFMRFINERLVRYNTGAEQIVLDEIAIDGIPIPAQILDQLLASVPASGKQNLQLRINNNNSSGTEIYIIKVDENSRTAFKVRMAHRCLDGSLKPFDLANESKGTQRLIELLPMFFDLAVKQGEENSSKVYIVDELDRSFHTELTIDLLKSFVEGCSSSTHHQLIFSTHDLLLMEEKFLRKDEMWFCEKDWASGSTLVCLGAQPGVRTDTSILKSYRDGIFGGYPKPYNGIPVA